MPSLNVARKPGCSWVMFPAFPARIPKGENLDELRTNMREVIEMLLQDGEPHLDAEFIGVQTFAFA
jgi:predicted RNase H-like HicB family nuclease